MTNPGKMDDEEWNERTERMYNYLFPSAVEVELPDNCGYAMSDYGQVVIFVSDKHTVIRNGTDD